MIEVVFKWISEKSPLIGIFLVLLGIAIYLTWLAFHWKSRIKRTEEDCTKIEVHIMPQLVSIGNSLNGLSGSFNSLIVYLKGKDGALDTSLFRSRSPITLTDLGMQVLIAIGGKAFIDKNVDDLIKEMDAHGIKTALDSQTFAPIVINQIAARESFNSIKNFAFKNPYYKTKNDRNEDISVPLDMGTISNVMGIYLRDKYLEKHPELNPADIPDVATNH